MRPPLVLLVLLIAGRGCVSYEFEHEFWLRVDGSGTVNVTGRPELWNAFKGLGNSEDPEGTATREAVRELFERSGLDVRRVTLTWRQGRPYLFISADFEDLNALSSTPAFPDLRIGLHEEGGLLRLEGTWAGPEEASAGPSDQEGDLMAIRFHLPSKVYGHKNAFDGVERGNIVSWRQEVQEALSGGRLEVGASMDRRSILGSTVILFTTTIVLAIAILAGVLLAVRRRGRLALEAGEDGRNGESVP
jgi:hypothetical protein